MLRHDTNKWGNFPCRGTCLCWASSVFVKSAKIVNCILQINTKREKVAIAHRRANCPHLPKVYNLQTPICLYDLI